MVGNVHCMNHAKQTCQTCSLDNTSNMYNISPKKNLERKYNLYGICLPRKTFFSMGGTSQKQEAESYLNEELMDRDKQLVGIDQEDIQPADSLVEDSHHHVKGILVVDSHQLVEGILVVDSPVEGIPRVEGTDQEDIQKNHGHHEHHGHQEHHEPVAKRVLCRTHRDAYHPNPCHLPFSFLFFVLQKQGKQMSLLESTCLAQLIKHSKFKKVGHPIKGGIPSSSPNWDIVTKCFVVKKNELIR